MRFIDTIYRWLDDQLGISSSILPVIRHPVPKGTNWWYVFGSATLVAFIMQALTGVVLAFAYVPAPNSAYESLEFITNQAVLGSVIRGVHFFGASAMVILVFIHMVRVFLMAAYKYPRGLTWLIGVGLLLITLGMAFTGQLLRWDQNSYWAIVVAAEQAGRTPFIGNWLAEIVVAGQTVGAATLTRFFATHVFLVPALAFGLIGLHLYLVVRNGISEKPEAGQTVNPRTYRERYERLLATQGVPFWPDAVWRDVVFALAVGAVVVALAILVGPPQLGPKADPTNIVADPRPDWYFIWYFALLALIPAGAENLVILGFPLVVGVVLLALPILAPAGERSRRRRPWAIAIVGVAVLAIGVLINLGNVAPWSPDFNPAPLPASVTRGLTGDAARGAVLFDQKGCHNCHTIAGTGGLRGPNLTTVGSRLSTDQLTWRILNGGNNMPAYGNTLTPADVQALVGFLSAQKGQ